MAEWKLADAEKIREDLTKEQEDEISNLYRKVYLDSRKQMLAIPKEGTTSQKIEKQYLSKLTKQLDSAYKSIGVGLEKEVKKQAKKAAEGVVSDAQTLTKKAGFSISGAYSNVPRDVVNSLVSGKLYSGDWSLSGAIWSNVSKTQKDITKVVAQGVAANKSAYAIAKDLESYVNPSAKKEWDWSKVYPGTSKKVEYNSQRLARTMVAHAYQQSLERVCKKNPFVDGYIWQSGGGSRTCPICADRNGKKYAKGELPLDHPNGRCTFIADLTGSMDDIANRLADWVKGADDPELDTWYTDMTGNKAEPVFNSLQKQFLSSAGYSPTNMPKNFTEYAHALTFDQQDSLLKAAGGSWSDAHPYQVMETFYNAKLATVRKGVVPTTERVEAVTKVTSELTKETLNTMFLAQKESATFEGELIEESATWWGKLTGSQKSAVKDYTGSYYIAMNSHLRGVRQTEVTKTLDDIADCKSALSNASTKEAITVGRGSDGASLMGMLGNPEGMKEAILDGSLSDWAEKNRDSIIGSIAGDEGFLSTTPLKGGGFSGNVTYRIYIPEGTQGVYVDPYSMHKGEKEFLVQCGSKFRVLDLEPGYGNKVTIYMELLK
jgi:SPP1 gp7 family putative phage head morphogenesis protein